jgi:hypothetical protein
MCVILGSSHIVFITAIKCLVEGPAVADLTGEMEVLIEKISIEQLKEFYLIWHYY